MAAASSANPEGMHWDPDRGRLSYEFWSAQREALDAFRSNEYDIVAILGGFGSGKTIAGSRLLISLAMEFPGSKHAANAIDFTKGSETTFETLFEQLPGDRTHILTSGWNGPEQSPIVADYNRQKHRLTFVNDSVIRLGSADYSQSLIGDEFMSVWLDEPSKYEPDYKLFDIALDVVPSRLRDHEPQFGQFWTLTGNGYNAAYRILRERENVDGEEIGQSIKVVYASNQDNPYLSQRVRDRFRRQYSGTSKADQALHGGFAAAEGLVYDVRRDDHIVPIEIWEDADGNEHPAAIIGGRTVPIEEQYRVYGYDQGWHPDPRGAIEIGRTVGGRRFVILDEKKATRTPIEEFSDWYADRPRGVIACEHDPEDIKELRSDGHDAIEANKSLDTGIEEVSKMLNPRDDDGNPLPPRLLIADRCEETINEFFSYKTENVGGSEANDHLMDCVRYAIMAIRDGEDIGGIPVGTVGLA